VIEFNVDVANVDMIREIELKLDGGLPTKSKKLVRFAWPMRVDR
jgi:hypothetical protein